MKLANKALSLAALLVLAPMVAKAATPTQISAETASFGENISYDANPNKPAPRGTQVNSVIYDNSTAATSLAFSSTDLTMTWGDEVTTTGVGTLSSFKWSVFNSGTSGGTLTGASFNLGFYDLDGAVSLGSYSGSVTFTTALGKGFYSVVTSTNLDPLNINLSSTHLLITQKVASKTGTATRLGIVSLSPVTTGSSPAYFYESGAATAAGYYSSASGSVNPIYYVEVAPPPVGTKHGSWSQIKQLYR